MENFYKNKNILVAGGSGMIGTSLSKRLFAMGANVSIASLDTSEKFKKHFDGIGISFTSIDLRNFENCCKVVEGQDFVFNMICTKGSSQRGGSQAADQFVPVSLCNFNLMDAARIANIKRYFITGSINQYPNIPVRKEDDLSKGLPEANDRFAAFSKTAQEKQGEAYLLQYGWDAVRTGRLTIAYGPYDTFSSFGGHLVPALIYRIFNGEDPLVVAGDGTAIRDLIFVEDAVDGILSIMEKAPPCLPINIGPGKHHSVKDIVNMVIECSPIKPKIIWDESKPTGDLVRVLNIDRARQLLSFEAKHSLKEGIKKTIEWYMENKNGE